MKKITSKSLAEQFVRAILNNNKMVQLWDNPNDNRIMEIKEVDTYFEVEFADTVNGVTFRKETMRLPMLVEIVWENRKFINQSEQLNNL